MSVKKSCINVPTMLYTGNEKSPLHYGLSAEGYDINVAMEGYDKNIWVVDVKNNKKVWIKKDSIIRIEKEEPVIKDNSDTKDVKEKNNPTDYNIFIKYRLHMLKNDSKNNTNKTNFDLVRAEWQNLKKDTKKMKEIMIEAKNWYEVSKDTLVTKKSRQKVIKID
jgi:hypothetical protein